MDPPAATTLATTTRMTGARMTTGTTTEPSRAGPGQEPEHALTEEPVLQPFARLRGVRTRILASYVGLLALATVASVLVARQVLIGQLDGRIDAELRQEADELRQLADGTNPLTARPFGDRVDQIFDVYLRRNTPSRNEVMITFVEGRPYQRSARVNDDRLDEDAELVLRWGTLRDADRGRVDTQYGQVEYLAVPLRADGQVRGVFVAAIFRERALALYTNALVAVGGGAWPCCSSARPWPGGWLTASCAPCGG